MGDFNSRTGNMSDSPLSGINPSTPRANQDNKIDTYGRNLIKLCKDLDLKIVNGNFGSDASLGSFTCHKKNKTKLNQSVVDYCIVSKCMIPSISDFFVDVFDPCMSDVHSPICLNIKNVPTVNNARNLSGENCEKISFKSAWILKNRYNIKMHFLKRI